MAPLFPYIYLPIIKTKRVNSKYFDFFFLFFILVLLGRESLNVYYYFYFFSGLEQITLHLQGQKKVGKFNEAVKGNVLLFVSFLRSYGMMLPIN